MQSATLPRQPARAALRIHLSVGEGLALGAGLCAFLAAVLGFVPGIYRDSVALIVQSHGQDLATLAFALPVLMVSLWASAHGSARGHLVLEGALGYLLYTYVVYAFDAVLNPATILYIAVVGCGAWSLFQLAPSLTESDVDLGEHVPRRATGVFFLTIAFVFGLLWLGQIATSTMTGVRPQALIDAGWPTSPIYVLDLALVLPLLALTGVRLLNGRSTAILAIPLLVFVPLLAAGVLAITLFAAVDGQPLDVVQAAIFVVVTLVGSGLAWRTLSR